MNSSPDAEVFDICRDNLNDKL
ncbi:unnamed protein product, partial [Rotaria sp. Silwood2]